MMRISGEVRDLAAASTLSGVLFASGVLVPLLGQAAGFFSAAPLIWLSARRGWSASLLGGLLATAALLSLLPPPVALIFAIEHALPAWFLGTWLRREKSIFTGSSLAALAVTIVMISMAMVLTGQGHDPVRVLEQQLRDSLAEIGGSVPGGSSGSGTPAPALNPNFEEVLTLLRRVLPAVTLIGIFLECSLNSLLAARVLAAGNATMRPRNLTLLRLPEWLVWVLIPALALCWTPRAEVATVALNALLPLLFAYLLQGLAITLHLAARARLTRFGRIMFASALVFFPWLLAAPLLLGLLDFRFDFRGRWPMTTPPAE